MLADLVSDDLMSQYTSYNSVSIASAKEDIQLLYDRFKVHLYLLLQTSLFTLKDIVSPLPLVETISIIWHIWFCWGSSSDYWKHFNSQQTPSGFFNNLFFQWGAVLYKRLAYWAFFHYSFHIIYQACMAWIWSRFISFESTVSLVYCFCWLRHWILHRESIQSLEQKPSTYFNTSAV